MNDRLVPQPPHDPRSLLLNPRVGWKAAAAQINKVEMIPPAGILSLARIPQGVWRPADSYGSFGGFAPPANVTVSADGTIYLLDTETLQLKRFNPCTCEFKTVRCIGGAGTSPLQFSGAGAIAAMGSDLFVCDSKNHRVSIFVLPYLGLRGHWNPPTEHQAPNSWEPFAIAFDHRGRAFVTDAANGGVHRINWLGRREEFISTQSRPTFIAANCAGKLVLVTDQGGGSVVVFDGDTGQVIRTVTRREELEADFPPLPFTLTAAGEIDLSTACGASANNRRLFDLRGELIPAGRAAVSNPLVFETEGTFYTSLLDSALYRCEWHRVIIDGDVPDGSSLEVSTFASDAEYSDAHIANLSPGSWVTDHTAFASEEGRWDCLIRRGVGRYLWLRCVLRGNGRVSPTINNIQIEFPRISLRRFLPAVFGSDSVSAEFTDRFLSIFDTTLRSIEGTLDSQPQYFDPRSAASEPRGWGKTDFLSWLGMWVGLSLSRNWPTARRRELLKSAAKLFELRGTPEGLKRQLLLFLGITASGCEPGYSSSVSSRCEHVSGEPAERARWQPPPLILEHFRLRKWLFVGKGRLGDQALLWGNRIANRTQLGEYTQVGATQLIETQDPQRDPFHHYAHKFTVFLPARHGRTERSRKAVTHLLEAESPAHTAHAVRFVEPRFRVGIQSMVGLDSVVGAVPDEITTLGVDSYIGKSMVGRVESSVKLGKRSQIGMTTRI